MSENNPLGYTPAGWYADPSGSMRWWDGNAWSQHVVGPTGPAPVTHSSGGHLGRWVALIIGLVVIAIILPAAGLTAYVLNTSSEDATPVRLAASGTPSAVPSPSTSPTTAPPVATPAPAPNAGAVVFSDTFQDPGSGWGVRTLSSGTRFLYTRGGFEVLSKKALHHFAYAPFESPVRQMSAAVTATENASAPDGAGFGVGCFRGTGAAALRFEFVDLVGWGWFIEEGKGPVSVSSRTRVLEHGVAAHAPGDRPVTVVGVCDTAPDGKAIRLQMFVDGHKVTTVNVVASTAGGGWYSGLVTASSSKAPSTVLVTKFVERDRSR